MMALAKQSTNRLKIKPSHFGANTFTRLKKIFKKIFVCSVQRPFNRGQQFDHQKVSEVTCIDGSNAVVMSTVA